MQNVCRTLAATGWGAGNRRSRGTGTSGRCVGSATTRPQAGARCGNSIALSCNTRAIGRPPPLAVGPNHISGGQTAGGQPRPRRRLAAFVVTSWSQTGHNLPSQAVTAWTVSNALSQLRGTKRYRPTPADTPNAEFESHRGHGVSRCCLVAARWRWPLCAYGRDFSLPTGRSQPQTHNRRAHAVACYRAVVMLVWSRR